MTDDVIRAVPISARNVSSAFAQRLKKEGYLIYGRGG